MTYIRRYLAGQQATTVMIGEGAITEDKISTGAVGARAIKDASIGSEDIKDKAILLHHLGDNIPVYNIPDGAITEAKLADVAVATNKIDDLAVTTPKINTGAVTASKLATDAVETAKIKDGAVSEDKVESALLGEALSFSGRLLHVQDQQALGTNGGDFVQDAWQTRPLNTVLTNEIPGATLVANQITLPAGTYFLEARAPCFQVNYHRARVHNITDVAVLLVGQTGFAYSGADTNQDMAFVSGRFTLAAPKVIELQHYCLVTAMVFGMGVCNSVDPFEVYADVKIWKVA
jgi:hypothetical protein